MDPRQLFVDERLASCCVYCGAQADTRDHVPPRVLLDDPHPLNLPVVPACANCNAGSSLDEEYLACLIECVICGSADPSRVRRTKVADSLGRRPALRHRIEASRTRDQAGTLIWQPEGDRVKRTVVRLALGHVAYELYPLLDEPVEAHFVPLVALSDRDRSSFECVATELVQGWPEIGSRAFFRAAGKPPDPHRTASGWIVVQPGRYRYVVEETGGALVRIVLSEYLACVVEWT